MHYKKKFLFLVSRRIFLYIIFIGWWRLVTFKLFPLAPHYFNVYFLYVHMNTALHRRSHRRHHHKEDKNCDCAYVEEMQWWCNEFVKVGSNKIFFTSLTLQVVIFPLGLTKDFQVTVSLSFKLLLVQMKKKSYLASGKMFKKMSLQ